MALPPDISNPLLQAALYGLFALLVGKICIEASAEALRRRLRSLDRQVFDLARQGMIGFSDQTYMMLRKDIKQYIEISRSGSLLRLLGSAFGSARRDHSARVAGPQWFEALAGVRSETARMRACEIRDQLLLAASGSVVIAGLPSLALGARLVSLRDVCSQYIESARSHLEFSSSNSMRPASNGKKQKANIQRESSHRADYAGHRPVIDPVHPALRPVAASNA